MLSYYHCATSYMKIIIGLCDGLFSRTPLGPTWTNDNPHQSNVIQLISTICRTIIMQHISTWKWFMFVHWFEYPVKHNTMWNYPSQWQHFMIVLALTFPSNFTVCSTVCFSKHIRKQQCCTFLVPCGGSHQCPVDSPHTEPARRKNQYLQDNTIHVEPNTMASRLYCGRV